MFFVTALTMSTSANAQDAIRYLGAFDTVGSDVSVTPLGEGQLEFCRTNTSSYSECQTFSYTLADGTAQFSSPTDGQFTFDLVTNVLKQNRPDGVVKTADMTPVAR